MWEAGAFHLERLQAAEECVDAEQAMQASRQAPAWTLPYTPAFTPDSKLQVGLAPTPPGPSPMPLSLNQQIAVSGGHVFVLAARCKKLVIVHHPDSDFQFGSVPGRLQFGPSLTPLASSCLQASGLPIVSP